MRCETEAIITSTDLDLASARESGHFGNDAPKDDQEACQ